MGIVLALIIVLLIPIGIYFYGKHHWEAVQAGLRENGEKLTPQEMIRPSVPVADNFFADPLWDELKNLNDSKADEESTGWDRLNPPVLSEEKQRLRAKYPEIVWPGKDDKRNTVILTAWNKKPENVSPEQLKRITDFVGEAMIPAEPFLSKLSELSKRPAACYPLKFEDGVSMRVPHLKYLLLAGQLMSMKARTAIALGNGSEAFEDVLDILSLSDRLKDEPVLISYLVRISLMGIAVDAVASGLKTHVWNDGQLQAFDQLFAPFDFLPELTNALRGERVCFNATVESMRKGEIEAFAAPLGGGRSAKTGTVKVAFQIWYGLIGQFDQTTYNSLLQELIEELKMAPASGLPVELLTKQKVMDLEGNFLGKGFHVLTLLSMSSMFGSEARMAETQDRVLMARLACALERYWLKNEQYPESLDLIAPQYLPKLPIDAVDLKPFKYRLQSPQEYLLYSIGIDHKDDKGEAAYKSDPGDWVWGKFGMVRRVSAAGKAEQK